MGCFLGDGFYVDGKCVAVIVSNGRRNEEKYAFPGDRVISVCMLKTVSNCDPVGGGTSIIYYWNGSTWIESSRHSPQTYQGYAQVTAKWSGAPGSVWWKWSWGDCSKIFKTGDPEGFPCDLRYDLKVHSVDDATSGNIEGSVWRLSLVAKPSIVKTATTGKDGYGLIDSLCVGMWDIVVSMPGYKSTSTRLEVTATENLITRLKKSVTTDAATQADITAAVGVETAARVDADTLEKKERQENDTALDGKINTESTARQTAEKSIWDKIGDLVSGAAKEADAWRKGVLDLETTIKAWISETVFELLLKNLDAGTREWRKKKI